MAVNIAILVFIAIFYAIITIVGIWAAKVTRNRKSKVASETMIVGGRDIGILLGTCTMAATWVGGGALNGSAEATYNPSQGLLWCIPMLSFGFSVILGGFFVKKLRDKKYATVLDPFSEVLGRYFAVFYFLVESFSSILAVACTLNALGGTLEVIAGLPHTASIILSAGIVIIYTLLGGIYSVAYTDVIQLALMVLGMIIVIPFAIHDEAVNDIKETFSAAGGWSGKLDPDITGQYIDLTLQTLFGGIPIQVLFQRLLAMESTKKAQLVSVMGGITSCFIVAPAAIIGAIGASTNWNLTSYHNGTGITPADLGDERLILPIVIQYLTPPVIGYFGLGAITAAVMSSADSACLGLASEFGRNVYQNVLRRKASQCEILWAIRVAIIISGALSALIAIQVESIIALYVLCADLTYVLTWPVFLGVMFFNINAYGTLIGIMFGIVLRIGGGEKMLDISGAFDYVGETNFPVKTFAMAITFLSTLMFSYLAEWLFKRFRIPARYDFLSSGLVALAATENSKSSKAISR